MHATKQQINNLVKSYVVGEILNDSQMKVKWHIAECDACYQSFLVNLTVFRTLYGAELVALDVLETEQEQDVFLTIRAAGEAIQVLQSQMEGIGEQWNFFKMPQLAFARGGAEDKKMEKYHSALSRKSVIYDAGKEIVVQLDDEVFPVEELAVRVRTNGVEIEQSFLPDEALGCHAVHIEKPVDENIQLEVEIVERV